MIIGIKGRPRSGKTLMGVNLLARYWAYGYYTISNIDIDYNSLKWPVESIQSRPHRLSISDIEKSIDEGITLNEIYGQELICIYISEIMQYVMARKSSSNTNILIAYMLSQLGKTNTTFIWDAQLRRTVDVILRDLTEYEFDSYKLLFQAEYNGIIYPNSIYAFQYDLHDNAKEAKNPLTKPVSFTWKAKDALPYMNAYKTSDWLKADVLKLRLTTPKQNEEKIKDNVRRF